MNVPIKKLTLYKYLFIVGNSRSGTGMMSRILGTHPNVFTFLNEIHFFDNQWDHSTENEILSEKDALQLMSWLLCIYTEGNLKHGSTKRYNNKAQVILREKNNNSTAIDVYKFFIHYIISEQKVSIACKQTPSYLLFTRAIIKHFHNSLIINMVRDPRDILLSQKNKWRIGYLATENKIPIFETFRAWANYHPFTISLLWKRNIEKSLVYIDNPNFINVRYEDLVNSPNESMKKICNAIGIKFSAEMLNIAVRGSSTSKEVGSTGIVNYSGKWKKGNLTNSEIYICETLLASAMQNFGYTLSQKKSNPFVLGYLVLIFFFKTPLAILLNIGRTKNIFQFILKRLRNN